MSEIIEFFQEKYEKNPDKLNTITIETLIKIITNSNSQTIMEFEKELKSIITKLRSIYDPLPFSFTTVCDIFSNTITRNPSSLTGFDKWKKDLIKRGETLHEMNKENKTEIAKLGDRFLEDGSVVLCHGYSQTVSKMFHRQVNRKVNFSVIVTETFPSGEGYKFAQKLTSWGVETSVIPDSSVAFVIDQVDMVVVGAEAVVESGGIINVLGTFQVSIIAKQFNKPFYVASESLKFMRFYPLNQDDINELVSENRTGSLLEQKTDNFDIKFDKQIQISKKKQFHMLDYTPAENITILFTDLGALSPSGVSDELIKLYIK
ncbi:translation initiation factor eif-2b subunit alpha [Anaeramoeba flamelloides]|uniref:Translation initiation factor eIF2B subunit alpha n=1 Tax=Anaeramoeba flamelloides TaxID=1746091 RepID=A0ABQ8XFV7_9EUKA|nr:translation initiation factor eif-2b subunit alpha [Anaeramoeba flamelloides]